MLVDCQYSVRPYHDLMPGTNKPSAVQQAAQPRHWAAIRGQKHANTPTVGLVWQIQAPRLFCSQATTYTPTVALIVLALTQAKKFVYVELKSDAALLLLSAAESQAARDHMVRCPGHAALQTWICRRRALK